MMMFWVSGIGIMITRRDLLLIEDDEDDIFIMKRVLKDAGIRNPLRIVRDGREAIEYLSGTGRFEDRSLYPVPAMVFLDLRLPLVSGHDVLTWIRQRDDLNSTAVAVVTSSDQPEDLRRTRWLGANCYLLKPLTADQLLEMAVVFNWHWLECDLFSKQSR